MKFYLSVCLPKISRWRVSFTLPFTLTFNPRLYRGVSSTVRRVVEKETGQEYAAKVIDLTGDKDTTDDQLDEFRAATIKEMMILRLCDDHHHISKRPYQRNKKKFTVLAHSYICKTTNTSLSILSD